MRKKTLRAILFISTLSIMFSTYGGRAMASETLFFPPPDSFLQKLPSPFREFVNDAREIIEKNVVEPTSRLTEKSLRTIRFWSSLKERFDKTVRAPLGEFLKVAGNAVLKILDAVTGIFRWVLSLIPS